MSGKGYRVESQRWPASRALITGFFVYADGVKSQNLLTAWCAADANGKPCGWRLAQVMRTDRGLVWMKYEERVDDWKLKTKALDEKVRPELFGVPIVLDHPDTPPRLPVECPRHGVGMVEVEEPLRAIQRGPVKNKARGISIIPNGKTI